MISVSHRLALQRWCWLEQPWKVEVNAVGAMHSLSLCHCDLWFCGALDKDWLTSLRVDAFGDY